eukprot:TRINITY_DN3102_c0_g1_i1.p1 TRINITY_DN3102_c0_g1~~TRINITY_DN3102_c0_g1_i1.p1  ORF type:complete len:335 (+),score=33.53 TRINITY_DN3102_c0_g1_i1:171-1175(+)
MRCSEESCSAPKDEEVAGNGNRVLKLLCSYGGNIMPRPGDGRLRYVGGENRLVVVKKDIRFAELMKILEGLSSSSVKLKYQLPSEDLDVLVSVTCDEDVQSMIEEYEKYENISLQSCAKFRVFLFPANPPLLSPSRSPAQRYLDMINGCVLLPRRRTQRFPPRTNPDCYAFSDGSGSSASITVSLVSSPSASPRFSHRTATCCDYRHSLGENAYQIQNQMKRVPSEGRMANPCSPSEMSNYGQYQHQHQHPQLDNHRSPHLQRVWSTPNLEQSPQRCCAQMNRCNGHGHSASATHGVRQEGLSSRSHNMFVGHSLSAASTRTASPLQHMYSFDQ